MLFVCTTYYSKLQSGGINIHISFGLFVSAVFKEAVPTGSLFLLWCCTDSHCEANVPTGSQFMSAMVLYKQRL
jgi:hypothetical protein